MDVNAILYTRNDEKEIKSLQEQAVDNLKRITIESSNNLFEEGWESPYKILSFMEVKTTWHPIESISASGSGY